MSLTPLQVYSQSADKQRIIIVGESHSEVYRLVSHVLNSYQRKFDYVLDNENKLNSGPVVILASAHLSSSLTQFQHHIIILGGLQAFSAEQIAIITQLADQTPKGGIIIYNELDAKAKLIGAKERADVTTIPYKTYAHKKENGQTMLITSTSEKVPVHASQESDLQNISAAREVLKRIGISSGQFYKAVSNYEHFTG